MKTVTPFNTPLTGLTMLAQALRRETNWMVTPERAVYYIRQLHLGTGCFHQCSHCFAQPSVVLRQATLSSFCRIAGEIGAALYHTGKPLSFLHLGASSDPSAIEEYYRYLITWVSALPEWQPVKIFTHGWLLADASQRSEFQAVIRVLNQVRDRIQTQAISVDNFSTLARADWSGYLTNVAENLRGFARVLPRSALKLQVHFPLERLYCAELVTLQHWRDRALRGEELPNARYLSEHLEAEADEQSAECAFLTAGVFRIGAMAGFTSTETALMARDGGVPFATGRALTFYEGRHQADSERALAIQREQTLKPLESFERGTHGVVIQPDGRVRFVDCVGYQLGSWLNDGGAVFSYMTTEARSTNLVDITSSKRFL